MGIKPVDFIGEKKGALGSHALTKKGLRPIRTCQMSPVLCSLLGSHALTKKGLRHNRMDFEPGAETSARKSCPDEEGIETFYTGEQFFTILLNILGSHALMKKGLRLTTLSIGISDGR